MKPDKADVFLHDKKAAILERMPDGYRFRYYEEYLDQPDALSVSLTLPLTDKAYHSKTLFPFFAGLTPEGWLLDITARTLKIDPDNTFDILLATCRDCIGAVSVFPITEERRT